MNHKGSNLDIDVIHLLNGTGTRERSSDVRSGALRDGRLRNADSNRRNRHAAGVTPELFWDRYLILASI